MYTQFFGLKETPFSIAPDPRYLFMSERHRDALAHLLYGLDGGGGFVLLTGEVGAGKTTVCRCFLEQIPENCNVAYIFNPKLTVLELLQSVCDEFQIDWSPRHEGVLTIKDYLDPLNDFLLDEHAAGKNNVLIIDEAQNLSAELIEQLRLLTNLETNERKLLQIVLIGQPELRTLLARPEMEQVAQRVVARFHLPALSEAETAHYIAHRMAVAGRVGEVPFDRKAVRQIHRRSRGVPRRINLLCDRALLGAYANGKGAIGTAVIDKAALEVFDEPRPPKANSAKPAEIPDAAPTSRLQQWLPWITRLSPAALLGAGLVLGIGLFGVVSLFTGGKPATSVQAATPAAPASATAAPSGAPSSTPPSGASAAVVSAPDATPPVVKPEPSFAFTRDENQAWRELGGLWKLQLGPGNPCVQAQQQQVECFEHKTNLTQIQQLDRPGVLTLYERNGPRTYALLTRLTDKEATLVSNGTRQTVSLPNLLAMWRGDFATFWRAPPEYSGKLRVGASGPAVIWLASRLALIQGSPQPGEQKRYDALLKSQVSAFQLANGLKADGVAGAETFMQLNRAIGIDEPRLAAGQ